MKRRFFTRRPAIESLEPRCLMVGDIETNLTGHWSLNSISGITAVDIAGNDNPGNLINASTWSASGKIHGSLNFNGTNQSVSIPHSSNLAIGSNRLVVSAWIKTTASDGTIVSKAAPTSDHLALRVVGGKARFEFSFGAIVGVTGAKEVSDGTWHHIVGVRTASRSVALFVDGVADGTFSPSTSPGAIDETSPLLIGAHSNGDYFNGAIDDVRFYNGRLFTAEDADLLFESAMNPVAVDDTIPLTSTSTTIGAASGVLVNDVPRDEVPIQAVLKRKATNGTVTLNANGSFTYVMENGYVGPDSFEYYVDDGTADPIGATVQLTVGSWVIERRIYNSAMSGASAITATAVDDIVALMGSNGAFSDLTYNSIDALGLHMSRLNTLSKAYSVVGGPRSGDATVLQKIVSGYTYLANTAPSAISLSNSFFDTTIDIPSKLWPGLIIARSRLTSTVMNSLIAKYYDSADVWDTSVQSDEFGGFNLAARARSAVAFQILKNALSVLTEVRSIMTTDLQFGGRRVSSRLPDNSFAQHSDGPLGSTYQGGYRAGIAVHIAAGNYGINYLSNAADVLYWLDDTTYGFTSGAESNFVEGILDGFAWYFKGRRMDVTIAGRANVQKGITLGDAADSLASAVAKAKRLGIQETELQTLADRLSNGDTATNYMEGNKSFFASDMMVQQRQGYRASVHMISQRTQRPQSVQVADTGDGAQNFFLGDGVTLIHHDGNEYGTSAGQEIYPAWDWSRLPGTTSEMLTRDQVRALSLDNLGTSALIGTKAFVGSVSNGTYGAAAMDYGRSLGKVTAKKGYFYFDEGFVALGAGINAPNATNPVFTTLNQVLQDGSVTVKSSTGAIQTFGAGETNSYADPRWISHGGIGYLLLGSNGTVTAQVQSQSGPWNSISAYGSGTVTKNVFSARVDHGNNPSGDKYAYAVLPGATQASLDSHVANTTFTVLSNTTSIQAVRHATAGITQIAFYAAGSLQIKPGLRVTVDKPCMLQVRELANGRIEISISDPQQMQTAVNLSVTKNLSGTGATWSYELRKTDIEFIMPMGTNKVYAGQSVTRTFIDIPDATIQSRNVFYNNATGFGTSGVNNLPTVNPINAIDPSKQALLPNQTPSTTNFTNYSRGLNGIVIDLNNTGNLSGISAANFQFAIWNSFPNATPNFVAISPSVTVSTFPSGGTAGSDRIKLVFADNAIQEAWLRITVLANASTGLATNEVFYFGNARGDITPNTSFPSQISLNALDLNQARNNQLSSGAVVSNHYDVDKNGAVNGLDLNQIRARQGTNSLRSFTAPSGMLMSLASSSIDSAFADTSWLEAFQIGNNKNRQPKRI
jgi:Polysaccharide lyase family 8, super-sandwich domain/Concanavalin A-like lectin/glucanases superfamily/Polysaccharide lyase family 8, C-terminal beta-sandwich domain/Bacterial Ig domain